MKYRQHAGLAVCAWPDFLVSGRVRGRMLQAPLSGLIIKTSYPGPCRLYEGKCCDVLSVLSIYLSVYLSVFI